MNWSQFKDPVSHMCLPGTLVASSSLSEKVAGSSPFIVMTNIFASEFFEFSENIQAKLNSCEVQQFLVVIKRFHDIFMISKLSAGCSDCIV